MDDVKKGLLLQLFSGCSKNIQNFKFRGDINILLAGDPGVSKSQLLQVHLSSNLYSTSTNYPHEEFTLQAKVPQLSVSQHTSLGILKPINLSWKGTLQI